MANHDLLILPLWYGCRRFCVGKQGGAARDEYESAMGRLLPNEMTNRR